MADYDSSLPIFSRSTTNPVIVSKDTSANALANPMFVQLSDGSAAVSITGGSLDVNITGSTGSITVTATDLDIRDLINTQDSVAIGDATNIIDVVTINSAFGATPNVFGVAGKYEGTPTAYDDGDAVPFLTDANGRQIVNINGTVAVTATDLDIRDLAQGTDSVAIGDGTSLVTVNADNGLEVHVNNTVAVSATDLDIRDLSDATDSVSIGDGTDTLGVNADGSINVVVQASGGTKVQDYDTAVSVAAAATSNHDYSIGAGNTFSCEGVTASASGAIKIEVEFGAAGIGTTKAVGFTSMANPTLQLVFRPSIDQAETGSSEVVRVARTNREAVAMDVYSTIMGTEN